MKKYIWIFVFAIYLLLIPTPCHAESTSFSIVKLNVMNSATFKKIENATIFIAETNDYYKTDKNGCVEKIYIPFSKSTHYSSHSTCNFGTITILAYKRGFTDYVRFNTIIYKGKHRIINIYLMQGEQPNAIIEQELPPQDYTQNLIRKFKRV